LCFRKADINIHNAKTIRLESGRREASARAEQGGSPPEKDDPMANPSPGYSIQLRVEAPAGATATSELVVAVAEAGAVVTAVDVSESTGARVQVDLTCYAVSAEHAAEVAAVLAGRDGVVVHEVADRTFRLHQGGKLEIVPKTPLRNRDDLSRAYTPGVARVCLAIAERPADARRLTVKGNTIAVVTDGSAVLGLGNIGATASIPVMEGKAALFKQFADVDAWPVALDTQDTEEIIRTVKALAPVYGGINLEDIAAPRCFEIERRLREELDIPVFHDDQHGTAIVTLAALMNALKVVGKRLPDVRIVVSGVGAAGNAIIQLLLAEGAQHVVACGRSGAIHRGEQYTDEHRTWLAANTNPDGVTGTLAEVLVGADVFIGVSAPNLLGEAEIERMAEGAIVFAMANPDPEVDPVMAARHAAVVATGRSDFPNQINNVLAFPGFFRGLLDAGAVDITSPMLVAAAEAIASCVREDELNASYIIPSVFDPNVARAVAEAVANAADRATSADEGRDAAPKPADQAREGAAA
jgi:malate dehydrogenase (oxaloacetate-decarboxylating)